MNENEVSDLINEMFPESYEFKVLSCENFEFGTDCVKFCIEMRVNVANKDEVKTFLQEFYQSSGCTFNHSYTILGAINFSVCVNSS